MGWTSKRSDPFTVMRQISWTFGLALFFFIASLLTLFVWIPNDIETGVIETFRRQVTIGDAMAPTMVTWFVLAVSLMMGLDALFRKAKPEQLLDKQSLKFLLKLSFSIGLGLVLMFYTGPVLVDLMNMISGEEATYRQMKATFPFKYSGYILGGFVMVFSIIRVVENKYSMSAAWASLIAVLVLTVLYDVPFENLLLPPNGDY